MNLELVFYLSHIIDDNRNVHISDIGNYFQLLVTIADYR